MADFLWEERVDNSLEAITRRQRAAALDVNQFLRELQAQPVGALWRKNGNTKIASLAPDPVTGRPRFSATISAGHPEHSEAGLKYDPTWHQTDSDRWQTGYLPHFAAIVQGEQAAIYHDGAHATWTPTVRWDTGEAVLPLTKAHIAPESAQGAMLEWDYGWLRRRLSLSPRSITEIFFIDKVPVIPPGATVLIIETTPSENTGIKFNAPYAVDTHGFPVDGATFSEGQKRIPVAAILSGDLPLFVDDSSTFDTKSNDNCCYKATATWAGSRTATAAQAWGAGSNFLYIFNIYNASTYYLYRAQLIYDSSALPDDAIIDDGTKVRVYCSGLYNNPGVIACLHASRPSDPPILSDFNYAYYPTNHGENDGHGTGWVEITLTETGRGLVSKTGVTRVCLRQNNNDFPNTAPSPSGTYYGAHYRTAEHDGGSVKSELYVVFSLPTSIEAIAGVAIGSIEKVCGVANADIESVAGVSNTS